MRKMILAALFAALAVGLLPAAASTTAKTVNVSITKNAFVPKSVTVNVGDSVKWTNSDTQNHQVSCAKCPFTSPVLKPNDTFTHVFHTAGKFTIRDPLHTKLKGTVTVNASNSVTLFAKPKVVKYLSSTTLSGTVGSGKANENVVFLSKACGETTFSHITTQKTGTNGRFALKQTPTKNTVYQVKWNTASNEQSVRVRPRIKFAKIGSHKYRVRVKAAQSFVGKRVVFQKLSPAMNWVKVKRVKLKKLVTIGTTDVSSASFKVKIRHGKTVRMQMKSSQAAPCYISGHSRTLTS